MNILKAILGLTGFVIIGLSDEMVSILIRAPVFIACWGGIMLLTWWEKRQSLARNAKNPMLTIKAQVADRRSITRGTGRYRQQVYYLTFKTGSAGDRMEFEVSEPEAKRFPIGEEGWLQYQGWRYLGFRRYILEDAAEKQEEEAGGGVLLHELEE